MTSLFAVTYSIQTPRVKKRPHVCLRPTIIIFSKIEHEFPLLQDFSVVGGIEDEEIRKLCQLKFGKRCELIKSTDGIEMHFYCRQGVVTHRWGMMESKMTTVTGRAAVRAAREFHSCPTPPSYRDLVTEYIHVYEFITGQPTTSELTEA